MNERTRSRAWRFVHPDLRVVEAMGSAGLQVGPQGRIQMVQDDEAVRQSLLILLTTAPGERVMRPTYGCELKRLVFAPNDETTAGLAIHYVRRAVERWEPRAEIVSIDAESDPRASGRLEIVLEYRVRSTGNTGRVARALDLMGVGS